MRCFFRIIGFVTGLLLTGCAANAAELSPANWPAVELDRFTRMNAVFNQPYPAMNASKAMIAANSEVIAVHAGAQVLKNGGTAMDAAVTTAFAQIVLQAGAGISFAGQMTLLYYEAETESVYGLDASFNTVLGETDPYSIPSVDSPSGRSVLVPGLMRGFEVAHRRFGVLPWRKLLEPAIYFAEHEIAVNSKMAQAIASREDALKRLPVTRETFTNQQGELLHEGDVLVQSDLAETLRNIAEQGTDHMYRGAWASAFVQAVQDDGGAMAMRDLERYEPLWTKPLSSNFRQYRLFAPGPPSFGGASTLEAMNLLERADLQGCHYRDCPAGLARVVQIAKVAELLGPPMAGVPVPDEVLDKFFPETDLSAEARSTKAHADMVWERLDRPAWSQFVAEADAGRAAGADLVKKLLEVGWGEDDEESDRAEPKRSQHTSGIVAVDELGNVVALMHSINSSYFGSGLRVGGISIPDTGAYQQALIAGIGPGAKLPEPDNPVITLLNGKPVLASSGHGAGLHEVAIQGLLNILEFDMEPDEALKVPAIGKDLVPGRTLRLLAGEGGFPLATLEAAIAAGAPIEIVHRPEDVSLLGYGVMMKIDRDNNTIRAGITQLVNGGGEGY